MLLAFMSTLPLLITVGRDSIWILGSFLFPANLSYRRNISTVGPSVVECEANDRDDSVLDLSPYASVLANDEEAIKSNVARRNERMCANVVDDVDINLRQEIPASEVDVCPLPWLLKFLLSTFFFVYVGMEIGFAGWISSYVILANLTNSRANAAYATSVFFSALAAGRVLAIPLAVFVSNSTMLRVQLSLTLVSAVIVVVISPISYNLAVVSSGAMGLACSSLFPLVMTLVGDYGYSM